MFKSKGKLKIILTSVMMLFVSACEKPLASNELINESLMHLSYEPLSEYEEYCKNYIYIKPESVWREEQESGTLDYLDNSVLEEKQPFVLNKSDEFDDKTILLTTDKYFSDKTFTIPDFHMVDVKDVKLVANYQSGNQFYALTLSTPSEENVIRSIKKLEIFAFTKMASPNMILTIAND